MSETQPCLCKNQLRLALALSLRAFRRTVVLSCVILNKCKKDRESQKDVEEAAHTRDVDQIGTNPPDDTLTGRSEKKLMRQEEMPGQTNTANTRLVQQLNQ